VTERINIGGAGGGDGFVKMVVGSFSVESRPMSSGLLTGFSRFWFISGEKQLFETSFVCFW